MKKMLERLAPVFLGALLLASCAGKQKQAIIAETDHERDSLTSVIRAKDSLINLVFSDINAISENLAIIKSRENLITMAGGQEGSRRPVEEINNDIAAIDRLLQDNRKKIESLERSAAQLRKANLRIEGLERMIGDLERQLGEKRDEVARLREDLTQRGIEVEQLTETVARREEEVETLSNEKVDLENQLNTVYYIVGSEKELRDAQIINKQGFIGRTLTVGRGGNTDSFTQGDSRLLTEIPVGHRRVTVVSSHPEGSYELVTNADKEVEQLRILDPARFWESSKVLIISYK